MRKDQETYEAFCERLIRYAQIERLIKLPPTSIDNFDEDFSNLLRKLGQEEEKREKLRILAQQLKQEIERERQQKAVETMNLIQNGKLISDKEIADAINEKMADNKPIYKDRDEMFKAAQAYWPKGH